MQTLAPPLQSGWGCRQGAIMSVVWFAMGALLCFMALEVAPPPAGSAAPAAPAATALRPHGDRHHAVPCPLPRPPGSPRKNLVFAAVGDGWTADKWGFGEGAGWDLIAVYYGNRTDWDCPQCTRALRMPDSMKWQMVWALMTEKDRALRGIWQGIRKQYEYVMVTDDDLIMDACVIDTLFDVMRRHKLLAAQPSNCRGDDSDNPYWVHWQLPGMELHYVNVVEVTAPAFDLKFLDTKVRPLLERTYSGWGLPFCFGAAAGFPTAKLAAVDSVCMIHPAREAVGERMTVSERIRRGLIKPGSIYARFGELTPFDAPIDEQRAQWKDCGMTEAAAHKARQAWPPYQAIHGTVLAEPQQQHPEQRAAAGAATEAAEQWLGALPSGGQAARATLTFVAQLAAAAAVGACAALYLSRRAKGCSLLPRQVVSLYAHASPRR